MLQVRKGDRDTQDRETERDRKREISLVSAFVKKFKYLDFFCFGIALVRPGWPRLE